MGRYLITGGAGFIGSHVARSLLSDGHEVVIADNLSTGKIGNVPKDVRFVECDLSEPESMDLLPSGAYEAVIHLAAQSSGFIGQQNPYRDMQANVGSTMLLARWCLENGTSRFIYASSMTVYGPRAEHPLDEDELCQPVAHYGASKLASENYLRVFQQDGLKPTSLRLYNVYGPGQNLGNLYQGMASIYLAYLIKGEELPITGSLDRYRDFVFIDDVVSAIRTTLRHEQTPSMVYNVGTGKKTTVRQIVTVLMRALSLPEDHPIRELPGTTGDLFGAVANIDRITKELDWRCRTSLEEGIGEMVQWAKTQI